MKLKEIVVRVGYTLLGALLMLCILLIKDEYFTVKEPEEPVAVVEEIPIPTTEEEMFDFEAEAEAKLAQLQAEAEQKHQEQLMLEASVSENEIAIETVSANSIEAAKVKWIKDYPMLNSTMTLEEKMAERSSYEETLAVNAFDGFPVLDLKNCSS